MIDFQKGIDYVINDTTRCVLLIILISLIIYVNSLGNNFVWQDEFFVTRKGAIVESLNEIPKVFTSGIVSLKTPSDAFKRDIYYRPIVTLIFSADHLLWGWSPGGYRLTNIIWHILNSLLIFFICTSITGKRLFGLITGLIFAAHPVHTASVTYVTNRLDIICMFFLLSSWYLFIKDLNVLSAITFALAIFSKETAIVFPLILILYAICFCKNANRAFYKNMALYLVSLSLIIIFYLVLRKSAVGTFGIARPLALKTHIFTMIGVLGDYIRLLFWPLHLTTSDAFPIARSILVNGAMLYLCLIVLAIISGVFAIKRNGMLAFSIFWFFITILPVSNIIPILYLRADHFLYIPSLGFCLFAAVVIMNMLSPSRPELIKKIGVLTLIAILLFYSAIVINRNKDWRNDITLFTKTLKTDPFCREAHAALGGAYYQAGMRKEALAEYWRSLKENPIYFSTIRLGRVFENMAAIYYDEKDYEKAEKLYKMAVAYEPNNSNIHIGLGTVYFNKEEYNKAADEFKAALVLDPHLTSARFDLALAYFKQSLYTAAIEEYVKILKFAPDDAGTHYNLGLAYEKSGNIPAAVKELKVALSLCPDCNEIMHDMKRLEKS